MIPEQELVRFPFRPDAPRELLPFGQDRLDILDDEIREAHGTIGRISGLTAPRGGLIDLLRIRSFDGNWVRVTSAVSKRIMIWRTIHGAMTY